MLKGNGLAIGLLIGVLFTSGAIVAAPTVASRVQGVFFASRSSNPIPSPQPGFYNASGTLQVCDNDVCYPLASPIPTPSPYPSADAGVALGSAAAATVDTRVTGGTGTKAYRLQDVVRALKVSGTLDP